MKPFDSLDDEEKEEIFSAYLDGELPSEEVQVLETRLAVDSEARDRLEALRKTWQLLDFLPKAEVSASFTERTMKKLVLPTRTLPRLAWKSALAQAAFALVLVLAFSGGFLGYYFAGNRSASQMSLTRDLMLFENKRLYEAAGDLDFLRKLDTPDLFGDPASGN